MNSRSAIGRRLSKLEDAKRVDPVVLHFNDGNKTPMTIAGTASNFFRLVGAIKDYRRPGQLIRGVLLQLDLVRRAVHIEGRNAQLFGLAQALVKGPVPYNQQPKTETGEKL